MLVRSYIDTYGFPANITNCSNNYGPRQFPEKLIPLIIKNALQGEKLPIYGDGLNVRDWLYVEDHVKAIDLVQEQGRLFETYNIGGKGHDRRYAINADKIRRETGWMPETSFEEGIRKTVRWYLENEKCVKY